MMKHKNISIIFISLLIIAILLMMSPNMLAYTIPAVENLKVEYTDGTAYLSWSSVANADGYEVFVNIPGYGYANIGSVSDNKVSVIGISEDTAYSVKVRAYEYVNNIRETGSFSNEVDFDTNKEADLDRVTGVKVETTENIANVSWNSVSGADGYEVYIDIPSYGYLKIGNVTTNSAILMGFPTNGKYAVKIRAYKGTNGEDGYGEFSSSKTFNIDNEDLDDDKKVELDQVRNLTYDLDKDKAWSVTDYTEDGNNNKIIIVKKYGNSKSSASDIKKAVEYKYPQLKGYVTENKNGVWFYLNDMKSSLTESYQQFNIGEIEVVFNPDTYECLYSIPSADVKDKKVNLSDVPTVDTPYDTNTIIKSYVETKFGRIPTEEPEEDKVEVNKEVTATAPDGDSVSVDTTTEVPAEEDIPVEEAELPDEPGEEPTDDVNVNVDLDTPAEETQEDQAETGSATFVKVRPKQHTSVEDIRTNVVDGDTPQSNYIVVDETNLSEEDWNNLISDLSTPQAFLEGIKSIDRKNYSFNVVKVTSPAASYTLLIDPLGYNYSRYVAVVD